MTRRTRLYHPKYFPFSPGIPWKIRRGKYIIPQMDYHIWNQVLENREIVVAVFGGAIESYFSLSLAEALVSIEPRRKLSWLGYEKYEFWIRAQSLMTVCNIDLNKEKLEQYPVPLFLDAENRAYLNCLNNYLVSKSYWGMYPEKNKTPILKQIFDNSLIPWRDYKPQLRRLDDLSPQFEQWMRKEYIKDNQKFIFILPERMGSLHDIDCLSWSVHSVREFVAIMTRFGLPIVICSQKPGLYYGANIRVIPYDISLITNLIKRAWMVLSSDIDWLLIAMLCSKANIISKHCENELNLYNNADFVESFNIINTSSEWMSPMDVYGICEGIL